MILRVNLIVGVIIDLEELALAVEVAESLGVDAMATGILGLVLSSEHMFAVAEGFLL
jgi:hypothetical protein